MPGEKKKATEKAKKPTEKKDDDKKDDPLKGKLKFVSEAHLKKRSHRLRCVRNKQAEKLKRKENFKKDRVEIFKRAERYVQEYRMQKRDLINHKRFAKNNSLYYIPAEGKLKLVIRIRGINRMAPMSKKILQLFRLRQIHNGVFIKVNRATMNMLRKVEPYVTYGTPNLKTISDMIYKRGYGKINGQRIPLSDNQVIAKTLGKYDIICIEDLIHEIHTVGPNFKECNNFLWPFKLSSPLGGYVKKRIHYAEGGDAGNREEDINKFVRRMN